MADQSKKLAVALPLWGWLLVAFVGVPMTMCTGAALMGGAPAAKTEVQPTVQEARPPPAATAAPVAAAPPAEKALPAGTFAGDGTYIVGKDIQPGTYRSSGPGSCYWARLGGLTGEMGDMLANNISKGAAVATIKKTDKAFETKGCGDWSLVE